MRKVAYTYIIGNYDSLKEPSVITEGWDYICFTDDSSAHQHPLGRAALGTERR